MPNNDNDYDYVFWFDSKKYHIDTHVHVLYTHANVL